MTERGATDGDLILEQFETAWQHGAPVLRDYLPPAGTARRALLEELIKIDLEYRWRGRPAGQSGPLLEEYLAALPELAPLPLDLIGEEYWVRQRWGDQPAPGAYAVRFPDHAATLLEVLRQIQAELDDEFGGRAPLASPVRAPVQRAVAPAPLTAIPALVEEIARLGLLTPAQQEELTRDLRPHHAELRPLVKELLSRHWLTAYQVNRLLQGRGRELVVGPYTLLDRLGEGATGWVFKAWHQALCRPVALKVLRHELLTDADALARFYREIQVISQLTHPNVIHAYDAGPIDGKHVLVMEHVEGTDLLRLVKETGALSVPAATEYILQAALGLQYIHERGLVHRDVKPSNLLLTRLTGGTRDSVVKVLDLGLARLGRLARRGSSGRTVGGSSGRLTPRQALGVGTPDFMAPEQALDFHRADIRADVYSLGCTFYFLLTGQAPFPGGTLAGKLLRHQEEPAPPLAQRCPGVDASLSAVVQRMLAKTPEQRYATPADVCRALGFDPAPATVPVDEPVPARQPPSAVFSADEAAPRNPRRQRWASWLTPLLVLLAVGVCVRWLTSGSAAKESKRAETTRPATHPLLLDFARGFGSAPGLKLNGTAQVDDGALRLTHDLNQAGSAFTRSRVPISKFTTEFCFVLQGKPHEMADGITFTIQGVGPDALGSTGGGLGYGLDPSTPGSQARIGRSVAIKFDLYDNAGEGNNSTGLYLDGRAPALGDAWTNLAGTGIDLHSGRCFRTTLLYDGTTLTVTLADTVTRATHTQRHRVNIPAQVSGPTAYVGFTGGTGGVTAVQRITRWTFDPHEPSERVGK